MNSDLFVFLTSLLPMQTVKTFYMVLSSTAISVLIGLPLGIVLFISRKEGLKPRFFLYRFLSQIVDIIRSFPFAILMVALIPLTRFLIGTSLGTSAAIVPLSIAAAPYFARLTEVSLLQVSPELIQAAKVMGSTHFQIVHKVLIKEALPSLIQNITNTCINLVGYSAMAGLVGGEGLGKVAIDYGYYRFNTPIMLITVAVLILMVQLFQNGGNLISRKILLKRGFSYEK